MRDSYIPMNTTRTYIKDTVLIISGIFSVAMGGYRVERAKKLQQTRPRPPRYRRALSVVTRLELSNIRDAVERIDPNAFISQHGIADARRGLVKGETVALMVFQE
jgi:hypothetical protein